MAEMSPREAAAMARAKRAWKPRPGYLAWVIGGLIAIVAFAIVKGLSDPTDQSVIFWLIPMLAIYMGGILFMQYRQANRVARDHPDAAGPSTPLVKWNILFAAILCTAIFAGVAAFYAGVDATFYPLGDSGPGFPAVLLPAIALVVVGAAKAMGTLRSYRRGELPGQTGELKGPMDIPDRSKSAPPE